MAVQTPPFVIQASSHSSELVRREALASLVFGSAGGVVPATPTTSANLTAGVAGCSDLKVNAPVSGMSVLVNAGQCYVPGSLGNGAGYGIGTGYGFPVVTLNGGSAPTVATNAHATAVQLTTQGIYYCYNDNSAGQVSLAIAASNATLPRIDVIGCQVSDAQYSGATNNWALVVITGTAAASPTVPATPANFIPLAYVWVPAASTNVTAGNILDLRVAANRNPFRAAMYNSATQVYGASGSQILAFNTVTIDLTASLTTGAAAKFTAPTSGLYVVSTAAQSASLSIYMQANIFVNSAIVRYLQGGDSPSITNGSGGTAVVPLNTADVLQVQFYSNAASTLSAGQVNSYLDVALLSPA